MPYICRLLRHDSNSRTIWTLFPLWHCIIFPSLCNAELHIIPLGKTKHNHHSYRHPIVSCVTPQQNSLCQSEAPVSQILGSLVWASHRNSFSSFRTTKMLRADLCLYTPFHLPGRCLNNKAQVLWKEHSVPVTLPSRVLNLSHHNADSFPISSLSSLPVSLPAVVCYLYSALGVTAGAHRLWSHRSYKASFSLRVFLALANSMAFQVKRKSSTCIIFSSITCQQLHFWNLNIFKIIWNVRWAIYLQHW